MSVSGFRPLLLIGFVAWTSCTGFAATAEEVRGDSATFQFVSKYVAAEVSLRQPAFRTLSVDSLGLGEFAASSLRLPAETETEYSVQRDGNTVEYRAVKAAETSPACWTLEFLDREIRLLSRWSMDGQPDPLTFEIDPDICHVTLLGMLNEDGSVCLPALIHFPGQGTLRVTSPGVKGSSLGYYSRRYPDGQVRIGFPAATEQQPTLEYRLETTAVYPPVKGGETDARFNGHRRSWLNILQLNPRLRCLANHAGSDACAFTLYEYSEIALRTPPLAENLTALDLLRQTLDRYAEGMLAYGMVGYVAFDIPHSPPLGPHDFLDTYPSLLISSWNYVRGSDDRDWLNRNYGTLSAWTAKMLAGDHDGNGLVEYPLSGNSGSWPERVKTRPANWWDTIGFGHEDAYSNALAYRALRGMAEMADWNGMADDANRFGAAADKLRSAYFPTFLNPETGVLAGWKSADGELHDYYFTFVNGMAITFGLVPRAEADKIMDRMLAKMKDVGYDRFDFGLPGNLIPVARKDYVHLVLRWGGGQREDNSDGFQIYENGGASACFAYYTIQALYDLGRRKEADAMLFGMLEGIQRRGFQGRGPNGMTYDWKAWDGTPHGYEGFLVDNYLVLLAVVTGHGG